MYKYVHHPSELIIRPFRLSKFMLQIQSPAFHFDETLFWRIVNLAKKCVNKVLKYKSVSLLFNLYASGSTLDIFF